MHKDNNMPRHYRLAYEMHSKRQDYKDRITRAQKNIQKINNNKKYNPVLEFSGGKDSIVLLHMAMQINNQIPVFNYHPGYAPVTKQLFRSQSDHHEIIKSAISCAVQNMYVANTPYCTGKNYKILEYFPCLFGFMDAQNLNMELLGIRGEESSTRRQRVKGELVRVEGQRVVSFPISHLTTEDVWAYIITNNLYYISHYDKYGKVQGYENVRYTSHFNNNELNVGGGAYFDGILFSDERNETPHPDDYWISRIINGKEVR